MKNSKNSFGKWWRLYCCFETIFRKIFSISGFGIYVSLFIKFKALSAYIRNQVGFFETIPWKFKKLLSSNISNCLRSLDMFYLETTVIPDEKIMKMYRRTSSLASLEYEECPDEEELLEKILGISLHVLEQYNLDVTIKCWILWMLSCGHRIYSFSEKWPASFYSGLTRDKFCNHSYMFCTIFQFKLIGSWRQLHVEYIHLWIRNLISEYENETLCKKTLRKTY